VPDTADAPELLDVDLDQLARPPALIPDRPLKTDPAKPIPRLVRIPETVESGI
jgi:hypothetical protein